MELIILIVLVLGFIQFVFKKSADSTSLEIYKISYVVQIIGNVFCFLSIAIIYILIINRDEPDFFDMLIGLGSICFIFFIIGIYYIILTKKSKVILNEDGMSIQYPFNKNKIVLWNEISEVKVNAFNKSIYVKTKTEKFRLSYYLNNLFELFTIIEIKSNLDLTKEKAMLKRTFI